MRTVILICGRASSGKDTLAKLLKENLDVDSKGNKYDQTLIRGNAQSVKDEAYRRGWSGNKDFKGRQILIDVTNEGYAKDIMFWEKETYTEAIMYKQFTNPNTKYLIIPDWRYKQSLDYFSKVADKVITIRIIKDNIEGTHTTHPSETDFLNFPVDIEVDNNLDLNHLKKEAIKIATRCSR